MRKLILKCGLSPGDIVMLTAAVRDLHHCYPGGFATDVRTLCPDLWRNNPYLTPLSEKDQEIEQIACSYPLIDRSNEAPYHCLHGFIEFLNGRLGLAIRPTAFKGDIHLGEQERSWYSQVREVTGEEIPFWIIAAGGKYDITIKWWETERYQEVVNHFRGRIQFVLVGDEGNHHPRLENVIDLRGQTSLRELVRLVYHAQGVLCSITSLMHLAAAVPTKPGRPPNRPCVVIAGGREPAHWEAYPGHQFIHTNGALACCAKGGCWKDRTERLRDGDPRDQAENRCVQVVNRLPRCMDMITPAEVVRRIGRFYEGGALRYLSARQRKAAERGIQATAGNRYDQQPLNLHNAGMALERFIECGMRNSLSPPLCPPLNGRVAKSLRSGARSGGQSEFRAPHSTLCGIVICGGGVRYFTSAWVCINMLRRLGCALPIQFWHLGDQELDEQMASLLHPLGVECVDAFKMRKKLPVRRLGGWQLKPYALLHSPFREVLLLDADNVPVVNPEFLFDTPQFRRAGAVFWPDYHYREGAKAAAIWKSCGLRQPRELEFEAGQILVDKQRCWPALRLALWFNENSDFYYDHLYGDKETFHLAFRKLKQPYALVPHPIHTLKGTMCQHDFAGRRIFQHRNQDKWDYLLLNQRVPDFWFEQECRDYIAQLQRLWDGGMNRYLGNGSHNSSSSSSALFPRISRTRTRTRTRTSPPLEIMAVVLSRAGRKARLERTLRNLARTDWKQGSALVEVYSGAPEDEAGQRAEAVRRVLKRVLEGEDHYILLLEDDLDFNRHLRHNLSAWPPLRTGAAVLASLYNPRVRELACDRNSNARLVAAESVFGSRAIVISRAGAEMLIRRWDKAEGGPAERILYLVSKLKQPVFYHAPSLVQHLPKRGVPGKDSHQAADFDPQWRA